MKLKSIDYYKLHEAKFGRYHSTMFNLPDGQYYCYRKKNDDLGHYFFDFQSCNKVTFFINPTIAMLVPATGSNYLRV